MRLGLLLASTLLLFGCSRSPHTTWQPLFDGGHHIGANGATILAFDRRGDSTRSVVFYFAFDVNSSTEHTSNAKSRTFDYRGTITTSPETEVVLAYQLSSADTQKLSCNGVDHQLRNGSVFYVSREGVVTQLQLAGQKPTKQYVSRLTRYFAEKGPAATEGSMTAEQPRPSMCRGGLIGRDDVTQLQRLLDAGADVNELEDANDGHTLLHCAADNGAVGNVRFLLEHGANPLAVNAVGKTPADSAREHGNNEIAMLIENYAATQAGNG